MTTQTYIIFNNFNQQTVLLVLLQIHQHCVIYVYAYILTKTNKILHYWYHNKRMPIATYFIAVCFKEIFLPAP
jgi:hypothetical protein